MIFGNIIEGVLNVVLFPLDVINFSVNWFLGIDWVKDVVSVVSYVLPWENILPLFIGIVAIFGFRIVISIIKTIWELLPVV